MPRGAVAHDAGEAAEIASSIGGPVVVKALGVAHKTERGAVRLGLREPAEIREAARELLTLGDAVLVERFESDVVAELIVGLHRDPQLGLLLAVGSGGTLVELVADTVTLLLPVAEAEVREAHGGACAPPRCSEAGGAANLPTSTPPSSRSSPSPTSRSRTATGSRSSTSIRSESARRAAARSRSTRSCGRASSRK